MSDLNLDSLTYDRRAMLTDGLGGLAIDILTGGLSDKSKKSLEVVGLSPIEIDSIEGRIKGLGRTALLRLKRWRVTLSKKNHSI